MGYPQVCTLLQNNEAALHYLSSMSIHQYFAIYEIVKPFGKKVKYFCTTLAMGSSGWRNFFDIHS